MEDQLVKQIASIKDDDKVFLISSIAFYKTVDINIKLSSHINVLKGSDFQKFISVIDKCKGRLPDIIGDTFALQCIMGFKVKETFEINRCQWIVNATGFSTILRDEKDQFVDYESLFAITCILHKE